MPQRFLMLLPVILLSLCLAVEVESSESTVVTVETSRGPVRGFHVDQGDDKSQLLYGSGDVFLGIPFARPPIGELRFRLPRAICSYGEGGVNATAYKPACPQPVGRLKNGGSERAEMSEDCLYLNVFSPRAASSAKYPVMVYIHGGGFATGNGAIDFRGVIRNFVSRDVIVVTLQYRLGILGFFTTYSHEFPANLGLFDMLMALRWVRDEIGSFGGDAQRVTLFGESAGGTAVSALSLSPLARGLFHQVLQQSGTVMEMFETSDSPFPGCSRDRAWQLCNFTKDDWMARDFARLADCMCPMDWRTFVAAPSLSETIPQYRIALDGFFLPQKPSALASSRPNLPAVVGGNRDEFAIFFGVQPDAPSRPADLRRFSSPSFLARYFAGQFPYLAANASLLADMATRVYLRGRRLGGEDQLAWFKLATEIMTDMTFASGSRREVNWYMEAGNRHVFAYDYEYQTRLFNVSFMSWRPVFHASELSYEWFSPDIWAKKANASELEKSDFVVADNIAQMWTTFAKTGRPSSDWPPVSDRAAPEFYRISDSCQRAAGAFHTDADLLFNDVFPSLLDGEFPPESASTREMAWLAEHYVPVIREEFERHSFCATQHHEKHSMKTHGKSKKSKRSRQFF